MSENRKKENRECKNSVFVDLFYENESAAENDIALYNALHDEPLPPGTTVEFEEGERLGREEGERAGREKEQKRFAALAAKLIEAGRSEDIIKAAQNFEFCETLYEEYNIE